jgi:hypothetical protein
MDKVQITITNQTPRLLICMLNSGRTIHLGPAQVSEPIQHLEINGNRKIEKLVRTGYVSIASAQAEAQAEEKPETHERTAGAAKSTASAAAHPRRERK